MRSLFKTTILSAAVAATTLALAPAASAGDRWNHHRRHSHSSGDMLAVGVLGLAAGALIAGAAAQPRVYYEYERPVRHGGYRYHRTPQGYNVGYREDLEPWSRGWFRYCSERYRSFSPESGTFIAYNGERRFCVAD